ncbi:MAG: methyltransferase family protein [Phycisphaerales bacterium]
MTTFPNAFGGVRNGQEILRADHPWFFRIGLWARRARNEMLVIGIGIGVIEGIVDHERPLDLLEWNWLVPLAVVLIAAGAAFRIAAMGCVRKNERLETTGVYSLCRHPLYLGTILLYAGFCLLLNDDEFYYFGAAYFLGFYTLMILWEEAALRRQFPDAHAGYRGRTPVLLPVGRPIRGRFAWTQARRRGAIGLLIAVVVMIGSVEAMARLFRPGVLGGEAADPPFGWAPGR